MKRAFNLVPVEKWVMIVSVSRKLTARNFVLKCPLTDRRLLPLEFHLHSLQAFIEINEINALCASGSAY
jgi:hypothetical protein